MDEVEKHMKIIIIGDGQVGKTSLVRRFVDSKYDPDYRQTIGVAFKEKQQYIPEPINEAVTFMLWDTAGQEEFADMTRQYYRGAKGAILVFSTTDRRSFEAIKAWNEKVDTQCDDTNLCKVLIQNKIDLIDQAVIQPSEAESLATELGIKFFRASVKENLNVTEIFQTLAIDYYKKLEEAAQNEEQNTNHTSQPTDNPQDTNKVNLNQEPPKDPKKKKKCCN
ncbi:hypothetical protein C9374_012267 [Naegleria lovaniensis]|uniref:Rab family small GTPase n=1 Tax=Naegleria lovaniensis TaxID=51637 RepID=A0AA88KCH0_NAELO|nr:uncharacterized protein C9374_012267 [Naegleria lovaniensis]KAG2373278.1 hypothetical protein C9374_012267 [Naegleria lovaniensis]